jgi:hypothetical protein
MSRDPLREHPRLPGEQRGKHDSQEIEDRGAGRRPGDTLSGDDERPSCLPGLAPVGTGSGWPVPVAGKGRATRP